MASSATFCTMPLSTSINPKSEKSLVSLGWILSNGTQAPQSVASGVLTIPTGGTGLAQTTQLINSLSTSGPLCLPRSSSNGHQNGSSFTTSARKRTLSAALGSSARKRARISMIPDGAARSQRINTRATLARPSLFFTLFVTLFPSLALHPPPHSHPLYSNPPRMSSITLRRCSVNKGGRTMYDGFVDELEALGDTSLSVNRLDSTFFRSEPDGMGNIHFQKSDGTPFSAHFIAEIGSEAQGTWLAAYPKKTPPAFKLPWNDANAKSHRMILALRCPTGAPPALRKHFRNGAGVCDSIRASDEKLEKERGENFLAMESVIVEDGEGDPTDKIFVLVRLHPTFEVPYRNPSTPWTRRRITLIADDAESSGDVEMEALPVVERKVGDTYPPNMLPEVQGPFWALEKAVLSQRDYKDVDGSLIPPHKVNTKLVEGTLVLVQVSLVTYVMVDQMEKGEPAPNKKVYHIVADKLRILDPSPQKRPRDEAADAAFEKFGTKLSSPTPSPAKPPFFPTR
ncbi:hypothetical protein B0H14DRAFT_3896198 [Mycena olivaceomarginata]|nr:hypothetical protein B0H14DRAFT_3896198 [Mycena olivaceomarginata]